LSPLLTLRNVWVEYGDKVVLERVNLDIEAGSFVSIIGPSGAGKSSLLRVVLGQEVPTRGTILLDGEPLTPECGPDRGVVFQRYSVFPHLTALRNTVFGLECEQAPLLARLFGARRRAAIAEAEEMLNAVGLGDSLHLYPAQMSGGMQQRLAIAQALIKRPRILLLDEPFGALDAFTREELWCILRDLWTEQQFNVILVTHDLRESVFLADTVYVMSKSPGRFVVKRDIELPRPRELELTYTKEFTDIVLELRGHIGAIRSNAIADAAKAPTAIPQ